MSDGIDLRLDGDALDRLAEAVALKVAARLDGSAGGSGSPWLTAERAAKYLGCSVSRVRTLTLTGELPHHRDGRRPLYHRDELDSYVHRGGARCP